MAKEGKSAEGWVGHITRQGPATVRKLLVEAS